MPRDNQGRHIISDKNYIPYLEELVLALIKDIPEFDKIYSDENYFIVYNVRELIRHQQNYRKENA